MKCRWCDKELIKGDRGRYYCECDRAPQGHSSASWTAQRAWNRYREGVQGNDKAHLQTPPEWFEKLVQDCTWEGIKSTCDAYLVEMECGHPEAVRGDPETDDEQGKCEWCESLKSKGTS